MFDIEFNTCPNCDGAWELNTLSICSKCNIHSHSTNRTACWKNIGNYLVEWYCYNYYFGRCRVFYDREKKHIDFKYHLPYDITEDRIEKVLVLL